MKKWKRTQALLGLGLLIAGFLPLGMLPMLQGLFPTLDWFLAGGMFLWIVLTAVVMLLVFPKMGDAEQYLHTHYLYMTDYMYLHSQRPLQEAEALVRDMADDLEHAGFSLTAGQEGAPMLLEAVRMASRLKGPTCALFVYQAAFLDKDRVAAVLEQVGERLAAIDRTLSSPCEAATVCFLVRGMAPEKMKESVSGYWLGRHKVVLPAAYDLDTGRVSFYTGDEGDASETARVQRLISRYILGCKDGGVPRRSGKMTPEQLHSKEILHSFRFFRYLKNRRAAEEENSRILMRMRDGDCRLRRGKSGGLVYYRTEGRGAVLPFDVDPDRGCLVLYDDHLEWCFPHNREMREERADVMAEIVRMLGKKGNTVCWASQEELGVDNLPSPAYNE